MNAARHARTRNFKNHVKTMKKIVVCEHKKTAGSNDLNDDGAPARSISDSDLFEEAHDQAPRRPFPHLMDESTFYFLGAVRVSCSHPFLIS